MVYIKFSLDNTDNNSKGNFDSIDIEYDSSKTIKEMLIDFVKQNNSKLRIASKDIESFEKNLSPDLLTFVVKAKILNQDKIAKKKVGDIFKINNCTVKIIDAGSILGGNKNYLFDNKMK